MSPLDRTDGGNKSQTRRSTKDGERGRPYSRRRDCRTNIISRFPEKTPFPLFLGRSLAAVYNVNERSLHVGPPLLERIRETSISLRWNARKKEEREKGSNRGPPSPLCDIPSTIESNNDTCYLIGRISAVIRLYNVDCSDNTAAQALAATPFVKVSGRMEVQF